jgi:hypothetical protein
VASIDAARDAAASAATAIAATIERIGSLPEADRHRGVNGEWSAVESLRHLVLVIDLWLSKAIRGAADPFHPIALPPTFMPPTLPGSSIDPDARPTFDEACAVLHGRIADLRGYVDALTPDELGRSIQAHAGTVAGALGVIFDELAAHDGFVNRDLERLELCRAFDDAIDVLEEALRTCPDDRWEASMWHVPRTDPWVWPAPGREPIPERTDESIQQFSAVWTVAYHCLWFLDFYVTADPDGFESPELVRGGPEELPWPADGAAPLADRVFSRDDLLAYAAHGRSRVRQRVETMPAAELDTRCPPGHPHAGKTLRELLDVNLAHVREHGTQLLEFVSRV